MRPVAILLCLLILVCPRFADACAGDRQERRMNLEKAFNKADQNKDKVISFDEFPGLDPSSGKTYWADINLKTYFELVDTDHDGKLVIDEWEKEIPLPKFLPQC